MKLTKGQKIWSIVAAVIAMSAVGIYIIKPGRKKKATDSKLMDTGVEPNELSESNYNLIIGKAITTNATNVNLRSAPSTLDKYNIVANVAVKGRYIGDAISTVPDADGGNKPWVYVQPKPPFSGITEPFYVRTDLISVS